MKKWLCVLTLNRDAKFTSHDMAYFIIGFWSALCTLPENILYVSICHWARCVCSQYSMCSRCVMALRFELSLYSLHTDALSISSWYNAFWQTAVVHSSDKEKKNEQNETKKKKKTKDENNQSVCSSVCRSNSIGWVLISIIVVVVSVSVHANATHFNYSLQICVALCVVWCYWWHDVHAARSLQQNCHTDERIEQQKYNCGTWHNTIVYTSNRLTWKQKRQSNPMLVVELSQKRSPEHQQKREDFHLGPSRPPGNFWGTCPSRSQGLIKPIYRSPARNTPFSHLPAMCVRLYVCVCKHWSAHATKCLAIGHPIIIFLKMHWN